MSKYLEKIYKTCSRFKRDLLKRPFKDVQRDLLFPAKYALMCLIILCMKLRFLLWFPKFYITWYLRTAPNSTQPTLFFIPCISASQSFLWFLQNLRIPCTFRPLTLMDLLDVLYTLIFAWEALFSYRS